MSLEHGDRVARGVLQRRCACGAASCQACGAKLERSPTGPAPTRIPATVHHVLGQPGEALEESTRREHERPLQHDLRSVRIHQGPDAAEAAAAVNARAFTLGDHIVFAEGEYRPGTPDGRRLMVHELTHVVRHQPSAASGAGSAGDLRIEDPDRWTEREAERVAGPSPSAGPDPAEAAAPETSATAEPAPAATPEAGTATAASTADATAAGDDAGTAASDEGRTAAAAADVSASADATPTAADGQATAVPTPPTAGDVRRPGEVLA